MLVLSLIFGVINRSGADVGAAILNESEHTVKLVLSLCGAICLWSGIMGIAKDSGFTELIADVLAPLLKRLFSSVKSKGKAMQYAAMNVTANLLGLGNAATPLGISAMKELSKGSKDGIASDAMITFTVLNTASIQLIPTTAAMLRLKHGASAPFDILPAVLITSFSAAAVSICAAKLCAAFSKGGKR